MEIFTSQDARHNLNRAPDMAYSKFGPNYELCWTEQVYWKLNLQYTAFYFFCYASPKYATGAKAHDHSRMIETIST